MSDEEDTTILLGEKCQDIEKLNTKLVIRQPVCVSDKNVIGSSPKSHVILLLTSFVAALGGLAFGYDMGIGSNMVPLIRETFGLNCSEQEVITSVWLIGAMIASFVGGIIIDGCGRRWAIICSALLLILGSIISSLANSFPFLLCGRLLSGFACALSITSQCIYAAEVSEAASRGCAIMLYHLGVAVGLLLSSIAGTGDDIRWQVVIWLSAIPAVLQGLLVLFFLPYSAHFKLLQLSQSMHKSPSACWSLGNLGEMVVLGLGLVLLQQLSGRSAVLFYAPRVFVMVGVCPDASFTVAAIILNIIKVGAVSLSLCIVDKMGRRPCIIIGATCMMTSIALLGLISSLETSSVTQPLSYLESCTNIDLSETIPVLPPDNIHYKAGRSMPSTLLPTDVPPPFPLLPTPVSLVAEELEASPWCPVSTETSLSPVLRYMALFAVICFEIAFSFGIGPITWLLLSEMFSCFCQGKSCGTDISFALDNGLAYTI
ncbi:hypothetical protein L9F63_023011, partial [Diploptera punctata]